jgi:predicted DNA-binding protein
MAEKMIAVSSEVAERLERLAEKHAQTIDEYLAATLEEIAEEPPVHNWALEVLRDMEAYENGEVSEVTYGSTEGRKAFQDYAYEKWKKTQEQQS